VNVNYSFVNPYTGSVQTIGFNQVGDNSFRAVVGGNIKVGPAIFNADVNIGSKTVFTSGLGVTL
jgi:hypothetical protein